MERHSLAQRVAAELRAEMARQRMTTPRLAHAAGITTSTLRRRLSGESSLTFDEVQTIADCLGINAMRLITTAAPDLAAAP